MAVQLFERGQYQQCLALLAANLPSTESAVAAPQSAAEAIVHESAVLACHTALLLAQVHTLPERQQVAELRSRIGVALEAAKGLASNDTPPTIPVAVLSLSYNSALLALRAGSMARRAAAVQSVEAALAACPPMQEPSVLRLVAASRQLIVLGLVMVGRIQDALALANPESSVVERALVSIASQVPMPSLSSDDEYQDVGLLLAMHDAAQNAHWAQVAELALPRVGSPSRFSDHILNLGGVALAAMGDHRAALALFQRAAAAPYATSVLAAPVFNAALALLELVPLYDSASHAGTLDGVLETLSLLLDVASRPTCEDRATLPCNCRLKLLAAQVAQLAGQDPLPYFQQLLFRACTLPFRVDCVFARPSSLADALSSLADVYICAKNYTSAITLTSKILVISADCHRAAVQRATALWNSNQTDAAIKQLRDTIDHILSQHSAESHAILSQACNNLAVMLAKQGQLAAARQLLRERALATASAHPQVVRNLCLVLRAAGMHTEADLEWQSQSRSTSSQE
eukprot:m.82127 g.82127  ORF g.82127 m.82127 type:complete len:517 (+) comp8253_c0_seq2:98-1648(+)